MKKPNLTPELENVTQEKILRLGALTETFDASTGRWNYHQPPRWNLYECTCKLIGEERLFNGPKVSKEKLDKENCSVSESWLLTERMIEKYRDLQTLQYGWKLTEHGVDFFYIYTRLLTKKKWKRSRHLDILLLLVLTMGFYAFYKMAEWAMKKTKEKKKVKKKRRRKRK